MITVEKIIVALFIIASVLVDFVLLDLAVGSSISSIPAMFLWGFLFAQLGLTARFVSLGNAFPLLRFACLAIATFLGSLMLSVLTELSVSSWLGILAVHAGSVVLVLVCGRIYCSMQRQFKLAEIFAMTTLVAILCALFPNFSFPWEHSIAVLPALIGFCLPVIYCSYLMDRQQYGLQHQFVLLLWPIAIGQIAGLIDGTPGSGFLLSSVYACSSFYLLVSLLLHKYNQQVQVPILKFEKPAEIDSWSTK